MNKKTLVILAAGIGSRFGNGIKQLEPVDKQGHIIIDYSIHDAIKAGFNKIVFIIRHDIEAEFKAVIGNRIKDICLSHNVELDYAFQELNDIPIKVPNGRIKPWGTGHAVLSCAEILDSPFAVINADDYYGVDSFKKAVNFLGKGYALLGYRLNNTLSDSGGVTRGICSLSDNKLIGIEEINNIVRENNLVKSGDRIIDTDSLVSMNFWCYPFEFVDVLKKKFPEFLKNMKYPRKDEFLLPTIADSMLREGVEYSVIPTTDKWFGFTYKEDKPVVIESFRALINNGVYKENLYSDIK